MGTRNHAGDKKIIPVVNCWPVTTATLKCRFTGPRCEAFPKFPRRPLKALQQLKATKFECSMSTCWYRLRLTYRKTVPRRNGSSTTAATKPVLPPAQPRIKGADEHESYISGLDKGPAGANARYFKQKPRRVSMCMESEQTILASNARDNRLWCRSSIERVCSVLRVRGIISSVIVCASCSMQYCKFRCCTSNSSSGTPRPQDSLAARVQLAGHFLPSYRSSKLPKHPNVHRCTHMLSMVSASRELVIRLYCSH